MVYKAYFDDYSFIFPEHTDFSKDLYGFNLEVKHGNIYEQALDMKIAETVTAIFRDFFNSQQNITICICDTSDNPQLTRRRKFDTWFWKYNDGSVIKEDGLAVIAEAAIYNSLLVHKQHNHLHNIIKAFRDLNNRANDK